MVKFVRTPLLEVGYEEHGDPSAEPVVMMHGWPDDIRTWDGIVPELVAAGRRVLTPYQRGYGPTRFLNEQTPRVMQNATLAQDVVDFADALGLDRMTLVGHDWGARSVYGAAVLIPDRVRSVVGLATPYGGNMASASLSYRQTQAYWYQWFFGLERGRRALADDRRNFCKYLWRLWSPGWKFSEAEFETTAASWDNPDFVAITIHSYRHRWDHAESDPYYAQVQAKIAALPPITVPVTALFGEDDGVTLLESTNVPPERFTAGYIRRTVPGAGHFVQRERPALVAAAILEALQR